MIPDEITQRELRNNSGEIMRELDRGHSFVVTRNGTAVAKLIPLRRFQFVSADNAIAAFTGTAKIDAHEFRKDIDAKIDQGVEPRA